MLLKNIIKPSVELVKLYWIFLVAESGEFIERSKQVKLDC